MADQNAILDARTLIAHHHPHRPVFPPLAHRPDANLQEGHLGIIKDHLIKRRITPRNGVAIEKKTTSPTTDIIAVTRLEIVVESAMFPGSVSVRNHAGLPGRDRRDRRVSGRKRERGSSTNMLCQLSRLRAQSI